MADNARVSCWCHPKGDVATVAALSDVLKMPVMRGWLLGGGRNHGSLDMKVGVDARKLQEYTGWMLPLVRLDPRGGLFTQIHMQLATEAALTSLNLKAEFQAGWLDTSDPQNHEEHVILCAFTTRVAMAHLRLAFDSCMSVDGHP